MTKSRILFNSTWILLLMAVFSLTSCDQDSNELLSSDNLTIAENLETLPMGNGEIQANRDFHPKHARGCLELVFPITIIFPNGNSLSVDDNESLRRALKRWYENNTSGGRPIFDFPITVIVDDAEQVVEDAAALVALIKDCHERPHRPFFPFNLGDCADVVYPITILFPDGTSMAVNDGDEFKAAIRAWYESGADSLGHPTLQYPIEIIIRDSVITINSQEELKRAAKLCRDKQNDHRPCFRIVYPISIEFSNGEIVEVSSAREYARLLKRWKASHPTSDERPMIVFPIEVRFRDGTTQMVNSAAELQTLKADCD